MKAGQAQWFHQRLPEAGQTQPVQGRRDQQRRWDGGLGESEAERQYAALCGVARWPQQDTPIPLEQLESVAENKELDRSMTWRMP